MLRKIYELSNETEDEVNNIIDSYSTIEKVKSDTIDKTSVLLESSNSDNIKEAINETEYTPYQMFCNKSTLTWIENLNLLESLSNTFSIQESKYLKIKDNFYSLMLKYNKEFMLNNIFIKSWKTYMSDELLEMFKSFVYLESIIKESTSISWLVKWMEKNDISKEDFIKSYIHKFEKYP